MPWLDIDVSVVTEFLNTAVGSSDRTLSMRGHCAHGAFEVCCNGTKIDGNRFPIYVHFAPSITKSTLELVEYVGGNFSFAARLVISESQFLELCARDFSTTQVRIKLDSGECYSTKDGYTTLRFGDDPDGDDLLWDAGNNLNAVQTIMSFVLSISQRLDCPSKS